MFFHNRARALRFTLAMVFAILLHSALRLSHRPAPVARAADDRDPDVIWSIGKTDNSNDEFAAGGAKTLFYEVGRSSPARDWRERQDETAIYTIRFPLDQPPPSAVLVLDCFFLAAAPHGAELKVNGKHGYFHVRPQAGQNLDNRQANELAYSRASLRMPLDGTLLRRGGNEISIQFTGEQNSVLYDSLSLRRSDAVPDLTAAAEPTIFYKRKGDQQLKEVTDVIVSHRQPLGKVVVTLKVGAGTPVRAELEGKHDFGEEVAEVEVPAVSFPAPYELKLTADGKAARFHGEFRPEKRWRIFAGLKIHNDIGYTDLQPHVQELDLRNTDAVIDTIARFPFYRFNFEDGWLVDNYLHSRNPVRVRQLTALAARGQVGISAFYLNLLTGLCTGEELHRSLYFSKHFGKKYGIPVKSACLTDAPSHTWAVPSLLADAGVTGFANGSNQTRAPILQNSNLNEDSPFYWIGPDGERVMMWYSRSYQQFHRLEGDKPTVDRLRRTIPQFLARYRRADYPVDAVMLYGLYTDNADMRVVGDAPVFAEWNKTFEFPKVTPATDSDYYAYIAGKFANMLPQYTGDAGAYWEDGAASSAAETATNRDSARLLPVAEMASALATAFDRSQKYPADEFDEAWNNLLFYDEHTWGSSKSTRQPARRAVADQWEFKRAYAMRAHWLAKDLFLRSMNRLAQNISLERPVLYAFNPDLWPRTDILQIEVDSNQSVIDLATNAPAPFDVAYEDGAGFRVLRLMAEKVPGMGYKAWAVGRVRAPAPNQNRPLAKTWDLESRFYRIAFDPGTGGIRELYDKDLKRDLVDRTAPFMLNELLYVAGGEGQLILQSLVTNRPTQLDVTGQAGAEILEKVKTPFGQRIRIRAHARSVPWIESEINVYDSIKRIDIIDRLQKEEVLAKEAVYFAFPFKVAPPQLAYEVQNAWVRPNQDQLPGACREWFTTQNVVVARDGGAAIAWATPDAPLVTLTDINRGQWLKHLDIKNGHIFSYAMNNYWFTNYRASQGGEFTFRYFISSAPSFSDAELAHFSDETRAPLLPYNHYDLGNIRFQPVQRRMPANEGEFFHIEAANAEVTAFKQASDGNGYILRLRETAGQKGVARLASPVFALTAASVANGVEDTTAPLAVKHSTIEIPLKPHKFTTVRVVFGSEVTAGKSGTAPATVFDGQPAGRRPASGH